MRNTIHQLLVFLRVFYVFFYVSDLIPKTKVVICEPEKFWPFWLWPKAALGIPVFIAPPCRATAIFLESEKAFLVAARGRARSICVYPRLLVSKPPKTRANPSAFNR